MSHNRICLEQRKGQSIVEKKRHIVGGAYRRDFLRLFRSNGPLSVVPFLRVLSMNGMISLPPEAANNSHPGKHSEDVCRQRRMRLYLQEPPLGW